MNIEILNESWVNRFLLLSLDKQRSTLSKVKEFIEKRTNQSENELKILFHVNECIDWLDSDAEIVD